VCYEIQEYLQLTCDEGHIIFPRLELFLRELQWKGMEGGNDGWQLGQSSEEVVEVVVAVKIEMNRKR
jgi:hypothetical protein